MSVQVLNAEDVSLGGFLSGSWPQSPHGKDQSRAEEKKTKN